MGKPPVLDVPLLPSCPHCGEKDPNHHWRICLLRKEADYLEEKQRRARYIFLAAFVFVVLALIAGSAVRGMLG